MTIPHYEKIGDIAVATIHNPPVNTLSHAVRRDLLAGIKEAFADKSVRALILIGDGANFVAGADIQDFGKPYAFPSLYAILDALMVAPKPVIAALHGAAFGGGCELALACQWRIATPAAQVAQPEVKLGLMPGGGGTQWWARLAGPAIALDVCTSGAPIDAHAAQACGVIDRVIDDNDREALLTAALALAHDVLDGHLAPRDLKQASEKLAVKPELFAQFRRVHAAAWKGLVAPWKIVDCIEAACQMPFAEGYRLERAAFRECEQSPQSRALIHLFFAERAAAKRPAADAPPAAKPLTDVGVIGDTARAHALRDALQTAGIAVTSMAHDPAATAPHWPASCGLVIDASDAPAATLAARAQGLLADADADAGFVIDAPDVDIGAIGAASGRPDAVLGIDATAPRLLGIRVAAAGSVTGLGRVLRLARQLRRTALASPAHTVAPAAAMGQVLVAAHTQLISQGVSLVQQQRVLAGFGFEQERLDALATQASLYDVVLPVLASPLSDHAVLQQLLYALVNGGARLLADGSAWRPGDIDVAAVQALGFPAHQGGPMYWAEVQGLATVATMLGRYRTKTGGDWLAPATLLTVMHGAHWRAAPAAR